MHLASFHTRSPTLTPSSPPSVNRYLVRAPSFTTSFTPATPHSRQSPERGSPRVSSNNLNAFARADNNQALGSVKKTGEKTYKMRKLGVVGQSDVSLKVEWKVGVYTWGKGDDHRLGACAQTRAHTRTNNIHTYTNLYICAHVHEYAYMRVCACVHRRASTYCSRLSSLARTHAHALSHTNRYWRRENEDGTYTCDVEHMQGTLMRLLLQV